MITILAAVGFGVAGLLVVFSLYLLGRWLWDRDYHNRVIRRARKTMDDEIRDLMNRRRDYL